MELFHALSEEGYVYRWVLPMANSVNGKHFFDNRDLTGFDLPSDWPSSPLYQGGVYVVQRKVNGEMVPVQWKTAVVTLSTYGYGQVCGVTVDGEPYCEEFQEDLADDTQKGTCEPSNCAMPPSSTNARARQTAVNAMLKASLELSTPVNSKAIALFTGVFSLESQLIPNQGAKYRFEDSIPGTVFPDRVIGAGNQVSWFCVVMGDGEYETNCGVFGPGWDDEPVKWWKESIPPGSISAKSRNVLVQVPVKYDDATRIPFVKEISCLEKHKEKNGPTSCTRCPPGVPQELYILPR